MAAHAQRKHAILSASSAGRWLACTPSARLEEKFLQSNPEKPSEYSEEGTLAHELAELTLRLNLGEIDITAFGKENKKLLGHRFFKEEMLDYVDGYVSCVLQKYSEAHEQDSGAVILLESKLDFSHIVEQGFGTGDVVILHSDTVTIIDLKYGKGVKVDAQNNPQLRLYGIGAAGVAELYGKVDKVEMIIVQPRLDHISTELLTIEELNQWADEVVKPSAEKAYLGEGEQVTGSHCKFCKVKGICRAYADQQLALARYEFKDPYLMSDNEVAEVYRYSSMIQDWANAVAEYMLDQALKGKKFEGFKVVEGTSKRTWASESRTEDTLNNMGYAPYEYMNSKLKGITDIKKLVGAAAFVEKIEPLIVKPDGKPTLVPDSDPRLPYGVSQIENDFGKGGEND
jgi:hypothetical protein